MGKVSKGMCNTKEDVQVLPASTHLDQSGRAAYDGVDEGTLEQLIAIEGKVPHEPGQGTAQHTVPIVPAGRAARQLPLR